MTQINIDKLQKDVFFVFDTDSIEKPKVTVDQNKDNLTYVEVCQMYNYVNLTFDRMMQLAELFGTKNFTVNQWSSEGCDTCDYGSRYVYEFTFAGM